MELIQKTIHTNTVKQGTNMQITLDDDFNVPDSKADVEKITTSRGEIMIQELEPMTDKIKLHGICHFYVLYTTNMDSYPISSLEGSIPFEETLNCDGIVPSDNVKIKALLEDLNISIINSRKLSIRCLVNLKVNVYNIKTLEAATELENRDTKAIKQTFAPDVECQYQQLTMTHLRINKKDIYRIKEEVSIPSNKPSIYEILWSSSVLNNMELKLQDGEIALHGDFNIFLLYLSDEENAPVSFLELEVPFKGTLPCDECTEGMISNIQTEIGTAQYSIKPNSDGEERIIDLECTLDLDIKIYEDDTVKLLSDVYSPNAELTKESDSFDYSCLLQKNNAKTRISQKIHLKNQNLMQICHVDGTVKMDEMTFTNDGIMVEGIVIADLLYLSANDNHPLSSTSLMVPFNYLIEFDGLKKQDTYEINAHLEQISVNLLDSAEVEIKAVLSFDSIAFENKSASIIKEISVNPLDAEKMQNMPGMVGYIVKANDTLWDIAKQHYTTVESIIKCNNLENEAIKSGDKLIIVK